MIAINHPVISHSKISEQIENLAKLRTGQVPKEEPTGAITRLRVQPERVLKTRNAACTARLGGR